MSLTDNPVFNRLQQLLTQENARFRVETHPAAGKSEEVARIRGTELGQGAKALVCKVKASTGSYHVLAVLAADRQADLAQLAVVLGAKKASLASPAEINVLTGCVPGAIPPFSFHPGLKLVADPELFGRYQEIAFNAGTLEASLILNSADYLRIAQPELQHFIRVAEENTPG